MDNLMLNDTISFYRKKQGLTQEELAQKLGVTNQSVSKWESAQCCPDISLLPELAEIFEISIDELFGKKVEKEIHYDHCAEFPWNDDNTIRVFQTWGKKILKSQEGNTCIDITFPKNCNETTRQYFKVEVFGNIYCDASINGDVISHGEIQCNQINGDIKECKSNISCQGNINGNVNADNNISCDGSIGGCVSCGNNISCAGEINGAVSCGNNVSCSDNIAGDVICGGDIQCEKIEGNVGCPGNIIYK